MLKVLLSSEWIGRLSRCNQLIVGFSGGLDSTVLLHALATQDVLKERLLAVHINHSISSNSDSWQNHCKQFCEAAGIRFLARSVHFNRTANVEEEARLARYEVFSSLMSPHDCLILGHHQGDQAETVLLQLFRGAGVDGLSAMGDLSSFRTGTLARPLLAFSREELEHYAAEHQLNWVEDESNGEAKYARNFLRHHVIPLLEEKWPGVVGNIARTAVHCQQAKANLDDLALYDSQDLFHSKNSLFIEPLKTLSRERMANVLRVWLKKNKVKFPSTVTFQRLIDELIFASPDATPLISWSETQVRRYQQHLFLDKGSDVTTRHPEVCEGSPESWEIPHCVRNDVTTLCVRNDVTHLAWSQFPHPLNLNEQTSLIANKTNQGLIIPNSAHLEVRFRKGGEEFYWRQQTKKLKKLFQEWEVPPWYRDRVPLLYINDQLAAVVGYAVSDLFYSGNFSEAWEILVHDLSK